MRAEPTATAMELGEGYGLPDEPGADARTWAEIQDAIRDQRNWWICSTRSSGRAHAMPVWGVVVDGRIVWSTGPQTVKAKNLRREPEMVMHLESGDEVIVVEATAKEITPDDLPTGFVDAYQAKYEFEFPIDNADYGLWELEPTVVLSWSETDFPTTAVKYVWSP